MPFASYSETTKRKTEFCRGSIELEPRNSVQTNHQGPRPTGAARPSWLAHPDSQKHGLTRKDLKNAKLALPDHD